MSTQPPRKSSALGEERKYVVLRVEGVKLFVEVCREGFLHVELPLGFRQLGDGQAALPFAALLPARPYKHMYMHV
jgi:hypothetical protein